MCWCVCDCALLAPAPYGSRSCRMLFLTDYTYHTDGRRITQARHSPKRITTHDRERAREQNSKAHSHPAHNHLRSCQGRAHALPEICRKTAEWPRALKHYDAPPLAVRTQSVARELAVPVGLSPPAECL